MQISYSWPCGMGNVSRDPQHSWADRVDESMEIEGPSSFAQAVGGRRRTDSVSSNSSREGLFLNNHAGMSDADKLNIHPYNLLPERLWSALFMLSNKEVSLSDMFADFKSCGIRPAGVRCVQRSSNGFVSVTFSTADYRNLFVRKSSFIPRRHNYSRDPSSPYTFVAVFDAPYELLDEALAHRLSKYGTVLNIRRCNLHGYEGVQSGTRVIKMELVESIPSFMRFGRKLLRVKHDGQVPTFRKCHLPDHVARSCLNTVCFHCDQVSHTYVQCSEKVKCSICKEEGHYAVDCPLSWWRRLETEPDNADDDENRPLATAVPQPTVRPPASEPAADNDDDDDENRPLATAVPQPTMRPPASDPPADVPDPDRGLPPPPSSPSSSPAASSVSPPSPDDLIDLSKSATVFPVSSFPASDASMTSSVPQPVDSALAPVDDLSDSALAAAASDVSVVAAATAVVPVAAHADPVSSAPASDDSLAGLVSPSPSQAEASFAATPVLFSSPASSALPSLSSPATHPELEKADPSPVPPDDFLLAQALRHSNKPKIKPKPIGRQPGKADNSCTPLARKLSRSNVVAPRRKDNNSS